MRGGRSLDNLHRVSMAEGGGENQPSLGEPGTFVSHLGGLVLLTHSRGLGRLLFMHCRGSNIISLIIMVLLEIGPF